MGPSAALVVVVEQRGHAGEPQRLGSAVQVVELRRTRSIAVGQHRCGLVAVARRGRRRRRGPAAARARASSSPSARPARPRPGRSARAPSNSHSSHAGVGPTEQALEPLGRRAGSLGQLEAVVVAAARPAPRPRRARPAARPRSASRTARSSGRRGCWRPDPSSRDEPGRLGVVTRHGVDEPVVDEPAARRPAPCTTAMPWWRLSRSSLVRRAYATSRTRSERNAHSSPSKVRISLLLERSPSTGATSSMPRVAQRQARASASNGPDDPHTAASSRVTCSSAVSPSMRAAISPRKRVGHLERRSGSSLLGRRPAG